MNQNNAFIKAFPITWVVTGIVAVALWFFVSDLWSYSFILGSATSLMLMSMMHKSTKKVLEERNPNASKIVVRNYVFRYLFYGLILAAAALSARFEVLATALGLLTFKISLYISIYLEKRGERHD
jgi:hypothetical protein